MTIEANEAQTARAVECLFTFAAIGMAVMIAGGKKIGILLFFLGILLAVYFTAFEE